MCWASERKLILLLAFPDRMICKATIAASESPHNSYETKIISDTAVIAEGV